MPALPPGTYTVRAELVGFPRALERLDFRHFILFVRRLPHAAAMVQNQYGRNRYVFPRFADADGVKRHIGGTRPFDGVAQLLGTGAAGEVGGGGNACPEAAELGRGGVACLGLTFLFMHLFPKRDLVSRLSIGTAYPALAAAASISAETRAMMVATSPRLSG